MSLFAVQNSSISDLSFSILTSGDPGKVAAVNIESSFHPGQRFERMSCSLTGLLPYLSVWNAGQLGFPFFILCFHRLISLLSG